MTLEELKNRVEQLSNTVPLDSQVFFELAGMRAQVTEITCEIKEEATEIQIKG